MSKVAVSLLHCVIDKHQECDLGGDEYLQRGVRDVLDAVSRTVPEQKAHLLGFALAARCCSVAAAACGYGP